MKKLIDRTITIEASLSKTAQDFGYKIETDSFDDVFHDGYSEQEIKNQSIIFNDSKMNDTEQLFPQQVATALEDVERDAYASDLRKSRINALENALIKIDLIGGGCEYTDLDNDFVQAKAGVISVHSDEKNDKIYIEMKNPEHLINSIVGGVGMFHPPLPSDEESSPAIILGYMHHLNSYFEVFGETKPTGDLDNHINPNINEDYFQDLVKENIKNLSLEEVVDLVVSCVEEELLSSQRAFELVEYLTDFKKADIKQKILELKNNELDLWKDI